MQKWVSMYETCECDIGAPNIHRFPCETLEKRIIIIIFFSSENERIGNSCWDGTNKTLDFSLDLR